MDVLDPGVVRFSSAAPQTVNSGGDPNTGRGLDWLVGNGPCATFTAANWAGTAVYTHPVTHTFTMLGLPTIRLHVATSGNYGQLNARLWDVAPNGQETFVSRGTYALTPDEQGDITWQTWGGGYTFQKGDTIRVELLAQDAPTERPSLTPFSVTVSKFAIELPSHDGP
jgi:predicted acyl esterase